MSISELLVACDATALARHVRNRDVSALELTEASIRRIEELNPVLNAVITPLFERAVEAANAGLAPGPFYGVPTLLKDIGATLKGVRWCLGMNALRLRDFKAPQTSYFTEKLLGAGFNILGKTNTPELGILPTTEPLAFGPTRNPYDLSRSTGGSSGGAAAAVSTSMVPLAHANDGGGSIRIPASCCGLVGLKPSRGRISAGPLAGSMAGGLAVELVVSKTVRDTAALLDVLAGDKPGDPYSAPAPQRLYLDEVGRATSSLRIGTCVEFINTEGVLERAHPDCVAAVAHTHKALVNRGHHVEEKRIEALFEPDYSGYFMVLWAVNIRAGLLGLGNELETDLGEADVEPLTWALAEMGRAMTAGGYANSWSWMEGNARRVASYFDDFDLYLTPTTSQPAPVLGSFDSSPDNPLGGIFFAGDYAPFTPPFNATGQPAISLPLYRTSDNLPVGVQLVAPYGREDLLLRVAAELEADQPFLHPPPLGSPTGSRGSATGTTS